MNSKLIFVVVFASVVQGSFALPSLSKSDSFLPQSAWAGFYEILANQEATLISKFNAFNPVFDIFNKYAAALAYKLKVTSDGDATNIAKALAQAKKAVDHSVDSIPIAAGRSSDRVKTARTQAHKDLDDAYAAVSNAFASAQSSNHAEALIKIEKFRIQAQRDMADLVVSIYDSMRASLNTNSAEVLSVTKAAERGSGLGLVHVINAVINAVKAYSAAYATGSADASLIIEIEGWRVAALNGLRADVENKFSGLKTIYINSYQTKSGLVSGLARDQYANTVSAYRYGTGVQAIFSVIKTLLRNAVLGFSDAGTDDFTAEDAAQETTIAKWNAGTGQILMSVHSDSKSVGEKLSGLVRGAATNYYNAIDIARKQSSKSSVDEAKITTLINSARDETVTYVETIFDVLRNKQKLTNDVEKELKTLQNAASDQMKIVADGIHKATIILAKATSKTDLTTANKSISTIESQLTTAMHKIANIIAYTGIRVLQASNKH